MTDPALVQALDALRQRRADLDDAIRALERVVSTEDAPAPKPRAARGGSGTVLGGQRRGARTDAVETILKERPGEGMSPEELAEELARRGVELRSENPPRAARAAANRARERNPEVVLVRGRFMWRPSAPTLPSQPTLPEDSG